MCVCAISYRTYGWHFPRASNYTMCVSPKKTINAARFLCYFLMGNWHQFPHLTIFTRRTFVDFNFIIHFFLSLFFTIPSWFRAVVAKWIYVPNLIFISSWINDLLYLACTFRHINNKSATIEIESTIFFRRMSVVFTLQMRTRIIWSRLEIVSL